MICSEIVCISVNYYYCVIFISKNLIFLFSLQIEFIIHDLMVIQSLKRMFQLTFSKKAKEKFTTWMSENIIKLISKHLHFSAQLHFRHILRIFIAIRRECGQDNLVIAPVRLKCFKFSVHKLNWQCKYHSCIQICSKTRSNIIEYSENQP